MSTDRVTVVESALDAYLASARPADRLLPRDAPLRPHSTLSARRAIELFEDQCLSRALDVAARELKKSNRSYYTISSAGHEQNAIVGAQLTRTDPCFLHYRSGAFMMARWRHHPGATPAFDTLLSLCASSDDRISQGRHKVWGCAETWVPPQTSTIASHVPKAMGTAFAIPRARRIGIDPGVPADAIVCCSFGDASANHATALSGLNAARYALRRGNPMPILFLCEDNGRGISVDTPKDWIHDLASTMNHMEYFRAEGSVDHMWDTAGEAIETCRRYRVPVFLHMDCVRLWGHAGSDQEQAYRTLAEIEEDETRDPLRRNAQRLIDTGAATPQMLREVLDDVRTRVRAASEEAASRPKLTTREEVMRPLAPYDEARAWTSHHPPAEPEERRRIFGATLPEEQTNPGRRTLAAHLGSALHDLLLTGPELVLFGEDVGRKGGVYGVTKHLQARFGAARVFDTLLDETTILGAAQGLGTMGLLPLPEIQYLAYVHNALDQLRGEACSLSFFSDQKFRNPMVVRIASFAYQKGFGGHFHNDHSIGALRDIPGLIIAAPSRGDDAAMMLRGAVAMARSHGRVVAFLEPIALYHQRDLYEEGDGGWLAEYPDPARILLPGEVGITHEAHDDLLLVSYANGAWLSRRAARRLERDHGIRCRVLDVRWLAPLPHDAIAEHASACRTVLVVDECRATGGGIADSVVAQLAESGLGKPISSVRAADTYVPLGPAAHSVLVSEDDIVDAARRIAG